MARRGDGPLGGAQSAGQGIAPSALAYLRWVRTILEPAKWRELLKELNAAKDPRTDLEGLCERVKQLFEGHHYLIPGFNNFLSKGYGVALSFEEEAALYLGMAMATTTHHEGAETSESDVRTYTMAERLTYRGAACFECKVQYALCFIKQAESALRNKRSIHDALVGILSEFKNGTIKLSEWARQWKNLLEIEVDNRYLIAGLNPFLPDCDKITSSSDSVPLGQAFLEEYAAELLPQLGSHELLSLVELLNECSDEFLAKPAIEVLKSANHFLKGDRSLLQKLQHLLLKATERAVMKIL